MLVVHQGLVLLGRRLGAHGAGSWAAPGGALAFGEGLEACAARELHEETGLEARHYELGPYTSDVHAEAGRHDLTVFVVARGIVGTPARREPDRCEGCAPEGGGAHPHMGTHNRLLRLGDHCYLEVIAIDPAAPPPARARWFGLDRLAPDAAPRLARRTAPPHRRATASPTGRTRAGAFRAIVPALSVPAVTGLAAKPIAVRPQSREDAASSRRHRRPSLLPP
ncbi:VOC family protein [Piscinibacter sakaiensis]|uniref:VOC family protein n=1 Tax=Piscinibacter sakaiensis TaxID=1547922 RepID=UPI00372D4BFA